METIELLTCSQCRGKGRERWYDFEGSTWKPCTNCDGTGTIEVVVTDWDTYEAEVMAAAATVEAVEEFLGASPVATPLPAIVHSDMSAEFFDAGVRRAFANELSISRTSRESVVAVSSTSDADVSYLVTRETCECIGHAKTGRCLHRCYAIWHWWVLECDAVAEAAHVVTARELIAA